MDLLIPCTGQELILKIIKIQNDINSVARDYETRIEKISIDIAQIGDILNTYRMPGDKYLLCNGASIKSEDYPELIAVLGGNTLPTIGAQYGYTYIKAKE